MLLLIGRILLQLLSRKKGLYALNVYKCRSSPGHIFKNPFFSLSHFSGRLNLTTSMDNNEARVLNLDALLVQQRMLLQHCVNKAVNTGSGFN
jgi:hypothetical protein